jgi:hypothetical protein
MRQVLKTVLVYVIRLSATGGPTLSNRSSRRSLAELAPIPCSARVSSGAHDDNNIRLTVEGHGGVGT